MLTHVVYPFPPIVHDEDSPGAGTDPGAVVLGQRRDADGSPVSTDGDWTHLHTSQWGGLKVTGIGIISSANSRAASTLQGGTTWSGTFEDIHEFSMITFNEYSSTLNKGGTLLVELSMDGVTVHKTLTYTVLNTNNTPPHALAPTFKYFRLKFTAGGASPADDHANFTVQTIFHNIKSKGLVSRLNDSLTNSNDVDNVRAVIAGPDSTTGAYENVNVDADIDGHKALNVAMIQHVHSDANNSSTTNLAAGNSYTFTGTGTSTLGVAALQVSLKADQNCLVRVQQSPDNTNWDIDDMYRYTVGENFGHTVQAVSSYFRVIVTTNSLTTTVFRLQTAFCPVVEALPRSLDPQGHLMVTLHEDTLGNGPSQYNLNRELMVSQRIRLTGAQFEGTTLDTNYWSTATNGAGAAITADNADVLLTSGTANGGYARLWHVRRARYVAGASNKFRSIAQWGDTGTANIRRRLGIVWGATMPTFTDGAFFQLSGTTFSVVTRKNNSDTAVDNGNFNGEYGYTYTVDAVSHVFEILYGNQKVYFVIDGKLVHLVNSTAAHWTNTMHLHGYMDMENLAAQGAAKTDMARVISVGRMGHLLTQPMRFTFAVGTTAGTILKRGPGNLVGIAINTVSNNSVVSLYDGLSSADPLIWTSGGMSNSTIPFSIPFYGIPFATGLTLAVSAANSGCTVTYE